MKYSKPEVTVLGDSFRVIETASPTKPASNSQDSPLGFDPAYDLDE